ncbi:glycosyltransferase family 2 protein [Enterobacillus tribolii]|uniref:Glycosyltransferase involved in cell wall biosynthesis n=1 Tax=Enterobacillus tribolii TaxID=1487935 RepID=A0A370Q848_9GAMM|nr:glycosyltransferase family 2 protein [Enterobacillus tribolii]MBW7984552.1 glycosyltransferase [Enterobacillus tribolii]RDK84542.1 glycosyltransferase involved in cell wall biosynthesis [Enterobacillus tribolii]
MNLEPAAYQENKAYSRSLNGKKIPSLSIVVPCYNESEAFDACVKELDSVIQALISDNCIRPESVIIFVDDGSKDNTWALIKQASIQNSRIHGVKLSRNRGHQLALMAGLSTVTTDICISIDADLQDDTSCIREMVEKYMQGNEIVYGVRNDRSSDSFFKRSTANAFYKFMTAMGVSQVANHADYRLLSKRALSSLLKYKEKNIYIRGMIPLIGFTSDKVYYSRSSRVAGESKYPLKKMIALAMEGVTSLSVTPLRIISALGFITCIIAAIASFYALFEKMRGSTIEGWTSVMISIFFLGGVQLLSLGVIGEYIGKIYIETKDRPKFFIEEMTYEDQNESA